MGGTSGISQCKTSSCQSVSNTSEVNDLLEIHWIFVLQTFKAAHGGLVFVFASIWCLPAKPIVPVSRLNLWRESEE